MSTYESQQASKYCERTIEENFQRFRVNRLTSIMAPAADEQHLGHVEEFREI